MRSKRLAIGLSSLLVSLLLVSSLLGACGPAVPPPPEELRPPTPEQPSGAAPSITVDKEVSIDGGATWVDEVEQCVCQNVEFQIIVSNDGDVPLSNIVITDYLPDCLEYVQGSTDPPPDSIQNDNSVWNFPGPLAPNSSVLIAYSAHVFENGICKNSVDVDGEHDGDSVHDTDVAYVTGITCECEPKMQSPQYPDVHGWDVYSCHSASLDEILQVADDWECTESGMVTDIRFWGSWKDDVVGQISGFNVEIYSNSLAGGYSHPDVLLWESFITDYTAEEIQTPVPEGWYNPFTDSHEDYNHNAHYQYDITDIQDAFPQGVGNIYWLSIWPEVDDGLWGWKSSADHWEDDACWSAHIPGAPASDWDKIYEPIAVVQSLDLAFVICGGEVPCQCEEWEDVTVTWTDESGTSQSWTGSCEDTVEPISNPSGPITVSSSMGCIPDYCGPDYTWVVTTYPGMSLPAPPSGPGLPAFTPQGSGWNSYVVTLNASCDGVECPPCTLYMRVHVPEVTPSINVDKLVSTDGGDTWEEDIEQCVCQNVQFQITVTNDGDVPLSNIVISDFLPDCLEYVDGPAVEGICKTQLPYIPYYNLPGTNTPTWKCSELAPGNSVQVIYTAHMAESGGCKNQVSVEGEYNGQIVTDVDGASVTGIMGTCDEEWLTVCRCDVDDFSSPAPSQALLAWIAAHYAYGDTRDCDEDVVDRYWAHTFTGLEPPACCHIVSATLEITVRNGGSANYDNESLLVGFIGDAGDSWAFSMPLSDWIALGDEETIILYLSDVYGDGTTDLLGIIESEGFLDVAIQDDSTVDCAVLHIIYGQ